jgi:tetratricopeptide (TPR) repeat protein
VDEPANNPDLPVSERPESHLAKKNVDFAAYQDYLKGRSFCSKMSEEDVRKSIAYFEAALTQAPQYAPAHAGLADAHNLFAYFGTVPPHEARACSMEFIAKALAIEPELAEGHTSLAGVKFMHDWDWDGAQKQFLRALELNPKYAAAHQRYADLLSATGKQDEAMEQMRFAQQLEPLAPVLDMQMAWTCYVARDFKQAEAQSWKALAMEPRFAAAQHTLGLAYEQMSMYEEALVELENARVCSDNHASTVAALGHAFALAGRRGEAVEMLGQLERMAQRRYVSGYWRSILYCGLGEEKLALEWLDNAFQERDVWLIWLKVEPRLDRLRHAARFEQLLQQIGLG